MLTHTTYAAKPSFALLLQGPPLSGKTNVAMAFPDPYFLDADDKLANAVKRYPGKRFWYDCPARRNGEIAIELKDQWAYGAECINAAIKSTDIKTIVLDSGSAIGDMIIAHILKFGTKLTIAGRPSMEMQHWGPYQDIWKATVMGIRASGKKLIVIVHDSITEDALTGETIVRPLIKGALKDGFGGMFTDIWHAETKVKPDPKKPGQMTTEYYVRTTPNAKFTLGNSLTDLPSEFVVTEEEIKRRIFPDLVASVPEPMRPV